MTTITSIKIEGLPLSNKISENIYNTLLKISPSHASTQDICCINGLYGYRAGIFGYLVSWLSIKNTFGKTNLISRNIFKKLKATDSEIITFGLSLLFRAIPIIGAPVWDPKLYLYRRTEYPYIVKNHSISSHFNLMSTLFLQPLFDSGSAILSKLPAIDSGFIPWSINNQLHWKQKLFNKGISWAVFKAEKYQFVFNIDVVEDIGLIDIQYSQLAEFITEKAETLWFQDSDIYICGNFGLPMRFSCIFPKVYELKNLYFENNGFKILETCFTDIKQTNFVFHKSTFKDDIGFQSELNHITIDIPERIPTPLPTLEETFNVAQEEYKLEIKTEHFVPDQYISSDNEDEWITI